MRRNSFASPANNSRSPHPCARRDCCEESKRCETMRDANQEWARWQAATGFERRVQEFAKAHRFTPGITDKEHIAGRRIELARELEGKHLIYLDTKHWVSPCHIVPPSSQRVAVYDDVLALLESLRQKGRVCCPLSSM